MDMMGETAAEAFAELERNSIHPSDEEIAAAAEGTASAFSAAEIRAHAGWCSRCAEVVADFQQFCRPADVSFSNKEVDAGWQRLRRSMPASSARSTWARSWMAAAAGFLLCTAMSTLWFLQNGARPREADGPQKIVRVEQPPKLIAANTSLIDLFPENA